MVGLVLSQRLSELLILGLVDGLGHKKPPLGFRLFSEK
jgi:hypothetical protein